MTLVDYFGGGFAIFTLTIVEVVGISWIYGVNNFMRDVKFMIGTSLGPYWKICLGGFIPASLALILVYALYTFEPVKYSGKVLPDYAMCKLS